MVELHVDGHHVHLVKRFRAIGTFPHAITDPVVDTIVAENMATSFESRVLEIFSANST